MSWWFSLAMTVNTGGKHYANTYWNSNRQMWEITESFEGGQSYCFSFLSQMKSVWNQLEFHEFQFYRKPSFLRAIFFKTLFFFSPTSIIKSAALIKCVALKSSFVKFHLNMTSFLIQHFFFLYSANVAGNQALEIVTNVLLWWLHPFGHVVIESTEMGCSLCFCLWL